MARRLACLPTLRALAPYCFLKFWTALGLALCPAAAFAQQTSEALSEMAGGAAAASPASERATAFAPTTFADLRLKLPFQEGQRFLVIQGNTGGFSHSGLNRYAWDFGLPEGTPVVAVAAGRVVRVKQDSSSGGLRSSDFAAGNIIVIDHGRGLFTQYLHLGRNSARVREGEMVRAGQTIALSGNTGYTSTPHLHFQVQNAAGQSLPARFLDVRGDGVPRWRQVVESANDGRGTSEYVRESALPREAFRGNGIVITASNVPAHLLRRERVYEITGLADSARATGASRVVAFLMGPQGGRPVYSVFGNIDPTRHFRLTMTLANLRQSASAAGLHWSESEEQSNQFALAIVPVAADGSYWSGFSVPVTVR